MALSLSQEYAMAYYDTETYTAWQEKFGTRFNLLMDAMYIRTLLSTSGMLPIVFLFNGDITSMNENSILEVGPSFKKPKDKRSIFDRLLGKDLSSSCIIRIVYAKSE